MKPTYMLLFAALITLGIFAQEYTLGKTLHVANAAFEAANRAWVAPVSIGFTKPLTVGLPITMDITVSNVGKEPASDVQKNFAFRPFPVSALSDGSAMKIVADNDACKGVMPNPQATVIYPGGQKSFHASWYPKNILFKQSYMKPPFGSVAMPIDMYDAFMTGKQALVVQSCVVYTSLGKRRFSAFCHYYMPGTTKQGEFAQCEKGNYTDR